MYVWLACNVDSQLSSLRGVGSALEAEIGTESSVYTLPMHISLKISFEVPESIFPLVLSRIEEIYSRVSPFTVSVRGIECEEVIVWLRMAECDRLNRLSEELNQALLSEFGIPLHEYDLDYKFHSTLYIDSDTERVSRFYYGIKTEPAPKELLVDRLVVGTSDSGQNGTYSVYKTYLL